MTLNHLAYYYLWVAPHVLQSILLVVLVRRGLHRQFPMFVFYTGFEVLQCGVLLAVSQRLSNFGPVYVQVFAVGLALSTAIRFGVIYELFRHFFQRYPALTGPGRFVFRGATVLLLLIAVALAISAPGGAADKISRAATYSALDVTTLALDRAVTMLQCGLLVSLFLFSRYFVLSWRSHAFGIALGLGVFASTELAISAVRLYVTDPHNVLDLFVMGAYQVCVLVWMFYLMSPARESQYSLKKLPDHDLEIWNRELQRLIQQ
jgi:hypothetical protein